MLGYISSFSPLRNDFQQTKSLCPMGYWKELNQSSKSLVLSITYIQGPGHLLFYPMYHGTSWSIFTALLLVSPFNRRTRPLFSHYFLAICIPWPHWCHSLWVITQGLLHINIQFSFADVSWNNVQLWVASGGVKWPLKFYVCKISNNNLCSGEDWHVSNYVTSNDLAIFVPQGHMKVAFASRQSTR